jgi:Glycosyl transferases group 1
VHTLHTFVTIDDQWVFRRYPEATVVAVSHSQIANVPEESRHNFHVSHNGCDFDTYDLADPPGKYLVFLGRMAPHKNPVDAIRIAQAVGMPLVMAGKPQARPEEIYFQDEVKPLIDGRRVRYIGPVNHEQKRELLKNAVAFLFPTSWPEPFGVEILKDPWIMSGGCFVATGCREQLMLPANISHRPEHRFTLLCPSEASTREHSLILAKPKTLEQIAFQRLSENTKPPIPVRNRYLE